MFFILGIAAGAAIQELYQRAFELDRRGQPARTEPPTSTANQISPQSMSLVISDDKKYGPIGVVFALMSWLIAIGVVIILGAVTGTTIPGRSHLDQGRR